MSTLMNSEGVQFEAHNVLDGAPTTFTSEKAKYQWLCGKLNNSGYFEGKVFMNTSFKPDPSDDAMQTIDCGMYLSESAPAQDWTAYGEDSRRTALSTLELGIQCHLHTSLDPLALDPQQDDVELAAGAWAQILSCASLVFKLQKRLFHYSVVFFGHYARIVRFDRSGIVATEKIDYTTADGGIRLTQFFVRYGKFQSIDRGHDPSATRVDDELARDMRKYGQAAEEQRPDDYVPPLFNKTLDKQWSWWKLEVYDEVTDSRHSFAVGKPHFCAGGVVGRGTFGYIAVPLDANNKPTALHIRKDGEKSKDVYFVYLKDTWRIDHPSLKKEGAVLLALNQKEVQYVPTLLFHGDLSHDTLSYNNWNIYHPEEEPQDCPLKVHQHYRLVVVEVGKPLSEFRNGRELVMAILCCIIAHKKACEAGYIHRYISGGNILLCPNTNGHFVSLLNDWELSRVYDSDEQGDAENHVVYRAGTWQFMSVHALLDPHKRVITIADELESLFHVLLHFAICFLPHNCTDAVGPLLATYFDDYTEGAERRTCGQMKYQAMNRGEIDITLVANRRRREFLKFYRPLASKADSECSNDTDTAAQPTKRRLHPIDALISELLGWFKALYTLENSSKKDGTKRTRPAASRPIAKIPLLLPRSRGSPNLQPSTSASTASVTPSATLAADEALRSDASKLQSHHAIEELLARYLTEKRWPARDEVIDVKHKPDTRFTPPEAPDNVLVAPSVADRSKRALEDGDTPRKSKRLREFYSR